MADIVINPAVGKIDFFAVKGDNVTNTLKLTGNTLLVTGPLSASSISTGGGGSFVTSVQPTSNFLSKFTGNSTIANSLVYDNGTNVGIGTTSPADKFHVIGNVRINGGDILNWSGQAFIQTLGNYDMFFRPNSTLQMILTGNGNLGIGSGFTNPLAKLHVTSATSGATLLRADGTNGTLFSVIDDLSDSLMSVNNSAGLPVLEVFADDRIVGGQYGKNDFVVVNNKVGIGTNNPTAKLQVTSSVSSPSAAFLGGNVGIGTTSPSYKLDVSGILASGGSPIAWFSGNYNRIYEPAGNPALYLGNNSDPANYYDNNTHFFRNRGGSSTYAVIEGNGNLGIGTTSVTEAIHVYRAANSIIRLQAGGGNVSGVRMDDASSSGYLLKNRTSDTTNNALAGALYTYTDNNKAFQHIHNGTPLFTILSGGNVGIGTTSPNAKLQVGTHSTSLVGDNSVNARIGNSNTAGIVYGLTLANTATATVSNQSALSFVVAGDYSATGIISTILRNTTTAASDLVFTNYNNGLNERMRIQYDGNVGIGTSSPSARLHVTGSSSVPAALLMGNVGIGTTSFAYGTTNRGLLEVYGASESLIALRNSTGNLYIQKTSSDVYINNVNSGIMSFATSNAQRMVILAGGSVSFGTASDILGSPGNIYLNGNTGTAAGPALAFGQSDSVTGCIGHRARIIGSGTSQDIFIQSQGASNNVGLNANPTGAVIYFQTQGSERVRIDSSGNLGIGTSSPLQILHINGNILIDGVTNGYTQSATRGIGYGSNSGAVSTDGFSGMDIQSVNAPAPNGGNYSQNVRFWTHHYGTGTGATPRMVIQYNGNVGIGATSPSYKLDINNGSSQFALRLLGSSSDGPVIRFENTGTSGRIYHVGSTLPTSGAGSGFSIYDVTGTALRMLIDAVGNVGIGTTSVNTKLQVKDGSITAGTADSVGGTTILLGQYSNGNLTVFGSEYSSGGPMLGYGVTPSTTSAGAFLSSTGINIYRSAYIQDGATHRWYTGGVQTVSIGSAVSTSEKMRINVDGNLGIGTTSPSYKLEVIGDARISGGIINPSLSAQWTLSGGGTTTYNGSAILWSNRVIAIPVEKDELSTSGYIDIYCPTSGTITYYNASNVTTTVTCTANGIPISAWEALYYEITPGQSYSTDQTKFRLVNYNNSTWRPSSNWLLICTVNGDASSLKWTPGQVIIPTNGSFDSSNSTNNWQIAGTTNYVPKFTSANKIGNSVLYDNGSNIGIGTTTVPSPLTVYNNSDVWHFRLGGASGELRMGGQTNSGAVIQAYTPAGVVRDLYLQRDGGSVGIGTNSPSYKFEIGAGTSNVVVAKLTQGYERVRYYGFDLLGYNDGNLWMIGNNATNGLILGSNWDWDAQAGIYYTPGTYGAAGGSLEIGQLTKNNANYTHGNTRFYTNGVERMRIINTGNVGIGASSPATKLDVRGVIQGQSYPVADTGGTGGWVKLGTLTIPQNGYTCHIRAYIHAGFNALNSQDYYVDIFFKTSNASSVDANGFAGNSWYYTTGYTTSDPAPKWVGNAAGVSATAYDLYLSLSAYTNRSHYIVEIVEGATWVNVGSTGQVNPGNGSSTVCVSSVGFNLPLGSLGVGTTSPAYRLDVNGTGRFTGDLTTNGNIVIARAGANLYINGTNSDAEIVWQSNGSNRWAAGMNVGDATENFNIYNYTTSTINFSILKTNGNVGIGSSAPIAKLDINGTSNFGANVYHSIGGQKFFAGNGSTYAYMYTGTTALNFLNSNDSGTLMTLLNGGNLGIGTTAPGKKLQVIGSIGKGLNLYEVPIDNLVASGTQAKRYEIARVFIDYNDWNNTGPVELELRESYYSDGRYKRYVFSYGYNSSNVGSLWLVEDSGRGANDFKAEIGAAVLISGDIYYVPIYIDLDYYQYVDALVRTNRPRTTNASSPSGGVIYINESPTGTNISSFSPDEVTYISLASSKTYLGYSGNVGVGTSNPTGKLHIAQANSGGIPAIRLSEDESTIQGPSANTQIRMGSNLVLNASNVMPFNVNASETMRIINNGNIGIGTTTPLGKLHVYGLLRVGGAANEQTGLIALGNDANAVGTYADNGIFRGGIGSLGSANYTNIGSYQGIVFNVQNAQLGSQATRMLIDVNGNVGIGTTDPTVYKLDVRGDVRIGNGSSTEQDIRFISLNGDWQVGTNNGGNGTNSNQFYLYDTSYRFTVQTGTGNIGVGTNSPSARLHVYDPNQSPATGNLLVTSTGGNASIRIDSNSTSNYTYFTLSQGGTGKFEIGIEPTTSNLYINPNVQSGAGNAAIYVKKSDGNVGIGTTSPASLLQVGGSSGATATPTAITFDNTYRNAVGGNTSLKIYLYKSGGETYGFGLNNAAGIEYHAGSSGGSTANHAFYTETTEKVRINSAGNLGIGTTNVDRKLKVIGDIATLQNGSDSVTAQLYVANAGNTQAYNFQLNSGGTALNLWTYNNPASAWRNSVTFAQGGNVGIGTTSPLAQLHAVSTTAGATLLRADGTNGTLFSVIDDLSDSLMSVNNSAGLPVFEVFADDRIVGGQYGQNDFVVKNNKVGIGTNNPATKLDVYGSISLRGTNVLSTWYDLSSGLPYDIYGNIRVLRSLSAQADGMYIGYGGSGGPLRFFSNSGTTEFVTIATSGNVGIGSTAPGALLNIRASTPTGTTTAIAGTNLQIDSNASNYISFINTADNGTYAGLVFTDNNNGGYIVFRNYTGDVATGSDCLIYGSYQDHIFQTGTTSGVNSRNEVMRIKNNGSVGIGTASPTQKLDVYGAMTATIFYDRDNGAYYVDPASTSNVNLLVTSNTFFTRTTATSSLTMSIDLSYAVVELTMSSNITTLSFSNNKASGTVNVWYIVTYGDGTARSITWPAAVKWPGGVSPTITYASAKRDIYQFISYDGLTNIYATVVAQNL